MEREHGDGAWVSVTEASSLSGYSGRRIRQLLQHGEIKGEQRPGGRWRIPRSEIDKLTDRPSEELLRVSEPVVGWWTHHGGQARFITLDVRPVSALERQCWALLEVLDQPGLAFPLHWAGHPYRIAETDPDYIDISESVPGRLDVAFALPAPGQGTLPPALTSGQVPILTSMTSQRPSGQAELYGGAPLEGPGHGDGRGCWVAQPLALSYPDPSLRAYLKPGDYQVRLRLYCQKDKLAFQSDYILTSPVQAGGLRLRKISL